MINETKSPETGGFLNTLRTCMGTRADRRNTLIVAGGIILWALANVVANEAMSNGATLWLIAIPGALAVGVIMAYVRFLRETDEYVRLLQYQGLALGFALSFFAIAIIEALHKAGHTFDIAYESSTVMLVSWALAQFIVIWRHR